jgi:hypothetical protein
MKMETTIRNLLLILVLTLASSAMMAAEAKPAKVILTQVRVADSGLPFQYIFLLDHSTAYRTVEGLKKGLAGYPAGSTVTWEPGCDRIGDEPLLSSPAAMKDFADHCRSLGLTFILVPSG